ncbi:hypothetical protein INT47_003936 [Mucor saturninus]|uniref:Uncharacterized protein n=1 Tax=Mucor saturninus TaxID=64648 RepID=A0A8H7QMW8_9FUNG|nr:hypothetical protein INT47_003936 [Mucor saturninus]
MQLPTFSQIQNITKGYLTTIIDHFNEVEIEVYEDEEAAAGAALVCKAEFYCKQCESTKTFNGVTDHPGDLRNINLEAIAYNCVDCFQPYKRQLKFYPSSQE